MQPCPLSRAPAALAGDDHVIVALGPKQDWLEHAALQDRLGELVKLLLVELNARLVGIGSDPGDVDFTHTATRRRFRRGSSRGRRRPRRFAKQRLQPHAELGGALGAHAATANWGRRPISSRASRTYASEPGHFRS